MKIKRTLIHNPWSRVQSVSGFQFVPAFLLLFVFSFFVPPPAMAGPPDPALGLTREEVAWLNEHQDDIRYGPNPYWPPGDYMENGEHKGIVSDYIKIFEKKLGITFKKIYYENWEDLYNGMMTGGIDLVGAAQETEERKKVLVFTQPFLTTRLAVLTRTNGPALSSLDDLNSMTLAGIKGYSSLDYVKSKYPGAKIVECDDDLTVLLKVSAGAADGAVADYMIASYLVDKYSITNIQYAMELDFHWDLRFAVNKEQSRLRTILDKVLNSISDAERKAIYHKWVGIRLEHKPGVVERNLNVVIGVFSFILLLLFVVIFFNRSLKRQVFSRTRELKENSEKLQESKEYLQAVLDSAGDAILVKDAATGRIVDVNQRMVELYGYSYEEALQVDFAKLSQGDVAEWLHKARQAGPQTAEWLSRHKDGHAFWSEVKINFAVIGGTDRFVIAVRDIAQRKQIEEQLRQSQKMEAIGTLAGGIAHDFNNILAAILGYTELALLNPNCDPKNRENFEHVLAASKRAKDLVKQILLFSRKDEESQKPVHIAAVVTEAADLLRKTIPKSVTLTLDIDDRTGMVLANATQLHQVVMNLGTNAYHAIAGETGSIAISLQPVEIDRVTAAGYPNLRAGRYARLTVTDTGEGMPPEIMARIFDPFFTTKERGRGTGMGLSVAHGIIHQHDGAIWAESVVGNGTTMNVLVPLFNRTSDQATVDFATSRIIGGHENILFIDDEPMIVGMVQQYLETLGYRLKVFTSPGEALTAFRAHPEEYDLVVTDQTMPEMTGDVFAKKAMLLRPDIPIILCTGHSDIMDENKAASLGIKALLLKPVEVQDLAREVRRVLDGG